MEGRLEHEERIRSTDDIEVAITDSEIEDYDSGLLEYKIFTYPADFTLEVLYDKWNSKELIIPKFQRDFVWNQTQASKLIESFLIGLPVPSIFLYTDPKTQNYIVIDGQQRLKSIFYFFGGYFGEEKNNDTKIFHLKGIMNERFLKKTYDEFEDAEKKKFKNCVLRAYIVQQIDSGDNTSIYHIFERLNTGGTFLSNQEIRNCVYRGDFNDLLVEQNKLSEWRTILGKPKPDSRKRDIELLLRFFALYDVDNYKAPLKQYLNKFMGIHQKPSDEFISDSIKLSKKTCNEVVSELGERPFHLKGGGLSTPIFDSVMVAFAKNLEHIPSDIKKRYDDLVHNEEYLELTKVSTTNTQTVIKRFEFAEKALFSE
ncbi:MAG: DUF262 domain-containing protein [candidate division Zixibacteria bacterium]|nr:DUF262 domain-containing protein [Candidatus Tariuqbacter arcticus]